MTTTRIPRVPRVGFLPVSNDIFGQQLAEEMRQVVLGHLQGCAFEVIAPADGILTDADAARNAAHDCLAGDVDMALVMFCSWAPEEIANAIAVELRGLPLTLMAITTPRELLSPCGIVASASNLRGLGIPFARVWGDPGKDEILHRIEVLARGAAAAVRLRRARIGIVGNPCPGMIDTTCSELELRQYGPELAHLTLEELLGGMDGVSEGDALAEVESAVARIGVVDGPSQAELVESMKLYISLRRMVEKHRLDGVGVRCWPEMREGRGIPPCYALSRLSDDGVPGADESDALGCATQLLGSWLSGQPTFNGDFGSLSTEDNTFLLYHCGACPSALAPSGRAALKHGEVGECGVVVDFPLKPGRVTLAKLMRAHQGQASLFAACGEVVEGPVMRGNPAYVKLDQAVDQVLSTMVEHGVEHHLIVCYGNISEELAAFSDFAGLSLVSPNG